MSTHPEAIILLHGLARTSRSMRPMAHYLGQAGYRIFNWNYPSTRFPLRTLVKQLAERIENEQTERFSKLHFVSHSMGGILIRLLLQRQQPLNLGNTVMLAPPNQGSELVDQLQHLWLFRTLNGPAGSQLGTDRNKSIPLQLGHVNYPVGVIAGNQCSEWYFRRYFPGPSDGKVSVERTRLEGMQDFLVLPVNHTFIMRHQRTQIQTLQFLRKGYFSHSDKN